MTILTSRFDIILGVIMLSAGAASGHALATASGPEDWLLFALAEFEFYGGLWLLCGFHSCVARAVIAAVWLGLLGHDLWLLKTGQPARPCFGRIATAGWLNPPIDLAALYALWRWRPKGGGEARIYRYPGRVALSALAAVTVGVAIERSEAGQFPIVASAPSAGSASAAHLDYLLYLPDGYHWSPRRWPMILFLHGAGASGRDLAKVRGEGLPRRIEKHGRLSFIVLAPQSPERGWNVQSLESLLDHVQIRYRVDPARVYLTGLSMGGFGSWAMGFAHPNRFAAIAPICGGGDPSQAARLRTVPIWVFHGLRDRVVSPGESKRMVEALKQVGGNVRFTLYPEAGHDSWTPTYQNPEFFSWLLSHRRPPKTF